jgi:hypothetical protein
MLWGLPRPLAGCGEVRCRFIGRIDAWWPEGVAGEADGRST